MEVSDQIHSPAALPPGKEGTHWIEGWLGPRADLEAAKRKIPSPRRESNPRTTIVQPAAQHYTDWAITAFEFTFEYSYYVSNSWWWWWWWWWTMLRIKQFKVNPQNSSLNKQNNKTVHPEFLIFTYFCKIHFNIILRHKHTNKWINANSDVECNAKAEDRGSCPLHTWCTALSLLFTV
jgi:hypothetical protein